MPRIAFTDVQIKGLKDHYNAGMTSTKKKDLIEQASLKLAIDQEHIKVWIGNYKRKLNPKGSEKSIKKGAMYSHYTGYHQYCNEMAELKGKKNFQDWGKNWRKLSEGERMIYKQKAEAKMAEKISEKSAEEKKVIQEKLLKQLQHMCHQLHETGVEMFAISSCPGDNPYIFGTDKGYAFMVKEDLRSKFEVFLNGEAVNAKRSFPYKAYKEGRTGITITGLPNDVYFKNPNNMGVMKLKQIMDCAEQLSMKVNKESLTHEAAAAGTRVQMQVTPQEISDDISEAPVATDIEQLLHQTSAHKIPQDEMNAANGINGATIATDREELLHQTSNHTDSKDETNPVPKVRKTNKKRKKVKPNELLSQKHKKQKKLCIEKEAVSTTEDMYIVEKVIKKRYHGGKKEYLVKWEGYSSSENTWEPSSNIPEECVWQFVNL